ncbi:MAG TPA: hypothetical protein VGV59_01955 [Pyrinomonadaceae bacterium]|nr:hypothetical protein [Pyrinomonadaceae bacterium]
MPQRHNISTAFSKILFVAATLIVCQLFFCAQEAAAKRRRPLTVGGRMAVVVDERLSALRDAPDLTATLLRRIGRGRLVALTGARRDGDGVTFYRVAVTRRTSGWMQGEAFVSAGRAGDDERLLRLIRGSEEFDRIERARLFLEHFPSSRLRPAVLLLYADAAASAAARLTRDALRRLDDGEMRAGDAPPHSYFLNFNGLDRYNRNGVRFVFDRATRQFDYDGAAWREIVRRHPRSPEAEEARARLSAHGRRAECCGRTDNRL